MPFSQYGDGRVYSIDPAMSMCAHRSGTSHPSLASMPSTNAFKNNAAVQLPPGLPPVYFRLHQRYNHEGSRSQILRCTDQRWTNKSVVHILRPTAYARTCRIRFRPLHATHSTKSRMSTKVRYQRIRGPSETTHREHAAVNLSQRDLHGTTSP